MLSEFVTQTAGGQAGIVVVVMLFAIAAFTAAMVWVYRDERRKTFTDAAHLPLEEDSHE